MQLTTTLAAALLGAALVPATLPGDTCSSSKATAWNAGGNDIVTTAVEALDYDAAFAQVLTLAGPVAAFFDAVLVEAPDPAVKAVRMGLLLRISAIFRQLADFSQISTR